METKLAAGVTAFKDGIAAIKTNPRRFELLKPAVMVVVSIIVVVAYSFNLDSAVEALKANDLSATSQAARIRDMTLMAWSLNFMGFAMFSIMPAFLYLVGTHTNITRGGNENIFKLAATVLHALLFVATVVMFFTVNDHQRVPVLLVVTSILMATLLVMTAVERHLLKRAEPSGVAAA